MQLRIDNAFTPFTRLWQGLAGGLVSGVDMPRAIQVSRGSLPIINRFWTFRQHL